MPGSIIPLVRSSIGPNHSHAPKGLDPMGTFRVLERDIREGILILEVQWNGETRLAYRRLDEPVPPAEILTAREQAHLNMACTWPTEHPWIVALAQKAVRQTASVGV